MTLTVAALVALGGAAQEDYFPLREGMAWTYRTHAGRDYVKRVLGYEQVGEARCAILQMGDIEKHWVSQGTEGVRLHRSRGLSIDQPILLFKFPLKKGDRWTAEARTAAGAVRYAFSTEGEEEVEVPAGRFTAWRIDWTMDQGGAASSGRCWLARGVGPVKEAYRSGGIDSGLDLARVPAGAGDAYLPLRKGNKWVYKNDYDEATEFIHEIVGTEKVGETECFVMEVKSHNEAFTRVLRKEWLASTEEGIRVHQIGTGPSVFPVEAPFFRLKDPLRKDDEWKGATKGSENAPRYHYIVEGEADVEVPAGKFKAWKVKYKIQRGERHTAEGTEWYARNAGLVRSEMSIRNGNDTFAMELELKEFKEGK